MVWIRPSAGLWFGGYQGNKHKDGDSGAQGSGGLMLGNIVAQLGLLGGGLLGFGERWGLYTGINGALSIIPFLGFGFIGVPLGIHIKKRWGFGIIIPVFFTTWWIGALVGIGSYFVASWMSRTYG